MRKTFLVMSILISVLLMFTACEPAANTTTANKPANAVNNANTAASPASSEAVEAEIKKLVADTGAALAKNDTEALDKIYGDNYKLVNLDGSVQNKAERLASFKSGDTKFTSFVYDEVTVRTNPEGTGAVVIARSTAKGVNKGQPIDRQVRVTQVWSKTKDGWKQMSGHATQITAAAPATTPAANTSANTGANTAANKATNSNR